MTMSPTGPTRPAAEDPEADGDATEELDDPAQHGEEGPGVEVGDVGEEDGVPVEPRLAEGPEQSSGAVVDEDPGQGDPNHQQGDVAGQGGLLGGTDLGGGLTGPGGQVAHDGRPSDCAS